MSDPLGCNGPNPADRIPADLHGYATIPWATLRDIHQQNRGLAEVNGRLQAEVGRLTMANDRLVDERNAARREANDYAGIIGSIAHIADTEAKGIPEKFADTPAFVGKMIRDYQHRLTLANAHIAELKMLRRHFVATRAAGPGLTPTQGARNDGIGTVAPPRDMRDDGQLAVPYRMLDTLRSADKRNGELMREIEELRGQVGALSMALAYRAGRPILTAWGPIEPTDQVEAIRFIEKGASVNPVPKHDAASQPSQPAQTAPTNHNCHYRTSAQDALVQPDGAPVQPDGAPRGAVPPRTSTRMFFEDAGLVAPPTQELADALVRDLVTLRHPGLAPTWLVLRLIERGIAPGRAIVMTDEQAATALIERSAECLFSTLRAGQVIS